MNSAYCFDRGNVIEFQVESSEFVELDVDDFLDDGFPPVPPYIGH